MSEHTLPYAYGIPPLSGVLRTHPEDFLVEEELGYDPEGSGEHVYLYIEKRCLNTNYVATHLAKFAAVPIRAVSFSGMKDKHALTRQWFSVHLPGLQDPDWSGLVLDGLRILRCARHPRKLRRGSHRANRFCLILRECSALDEPLEQRLVRMAQDGVPNYFGEQRFGRDGGNLEQARRWFAGESRPKKKLQGIYLSAARSFLFNQVLASRVESSSWNQLLDDELAILDGSRSVFPVEGQECMQERLGTGDIHPSGPLYGTRAKLNCGETLDEMERKLLGRHPELLQGLEQAGLKSERRSLRLLPKELSWQKLDDSVLQLNFVLPRGCFATSLMRELTCYRVADSWGGGTGVDNNSE